MTTRWLWTKSDGEAWILKDPEGIVFGAVTKFGGGWCTLAHRSDGSWAEGMHSPAHSLEDVKADVELTLRNRT